MMECLRCQGLMVEDQFFDWDPRLHVDERLAVHELRECGRFCDRGQPPFARSNRARAVVREVPSHWSSVKRWFTGGLCSLSKV